MYLTAFAVLVVLLTPDVDALKRDILTPQTIEIHVIIDSFAFNNYGAEHGRTIANKVTPLLSTKVDSWDKGGVSRVISTARRVRFACTTYNRWPSTIDQSQTSSQRIQAKKTEMANFVKSNAADLNAIFGTLTNHSIRLDVRLFAIEFITTEVISREDFPGLGKAEAGRVLTDFAAWYKRKGFVINADHVMLLTGLDLTSTDEKTAGKAYVGGMCRPEKFSVNELEPTGSTTLTIAHELGHSLGAEHDGQGNNCDSKSHIMAASSNSGQGSATTFRFSNCSVAYFTKYQQDCLLKTSTERIVAPPVGELISPDKMCELADGKGSHVCRWIYGEETSLPYSALCYTTWCQDPQEGSRICTSNRSPNGFVCGQGKKCYLGECLPSASVPASVTEACPLGDTPSTMCSSVATDSSDCYHADFRRSCCASCPRAFNTSMIGCEYGDKADGCSTLPYPFGCYGNADTCCKSCSNYYTGVTGCEYGDKQTWCQTLSAFDCYSNDQECCATCAKYRTGIAGCEYGDKATGCDRYPVEDICGIQENRDMCCQRCQDYTR